MMIKIDGEDEIIEMLKNSKNGLTFEEIQVHEKFQPEVVARGNFVFKEGIGLVSTLRMLVDNGLLIDKQGRYYLNRNMG